MRGADRRRPGRTRRSSSRSGSTRARTSTTCSSRPSPSSARRPGATIGQRHFDVQLMGGMALHFGWIAEMKTGEGKTLVSTLPVYLNALDGRRRPRRHGQRLPGPPRRRVDGPGPPVPRPDGRAGSSPDIADFGRTSRPPTLRTSPTAPTPSSASTTCATTWPRSREHMVQRGHVFAIVDEVDSILIDEARTPLIISGPGRRRRRSSTTSSPASRGRLEPRRRLRGRRGEAHRRPDRGGHREGRAGRSASTTSTTPCRVNYVHQLTKALAGQGALQAGQGLPRRRRRGEDRRRVHRPHPRGPALVRRPPPGGRGQGARARSRRRTTPGPR